MVTIPKWVVYCSSIPTFYKNDNQLEYGLKKTTGFAELMMFLQFPIGNPLEMGYL